jgi:hypothetical protein
MSLPHLKHQIQSVREELLKHSAFHWIDGPEKAKLFMEYHVWAVWDFMVLLKSLQRELTCVNTYWVPKGDPEIRRLINEIVFGEETDVDFNGRAISHFELYLEAMEEAGANTVPIRAFIEDISQGKEVMQVLDNSAAPEGAKQFVRQTLKVVEGGNAHEIAAVFTFGREDLIPDMFEEIVENLKLNFPNELGRFAYYLERHIEVDGDVHGHLASKMVTILCGHETRKWEEAIKASVAALKARMDLWTSVMDAFSADRLAQESLS